VIRRAIWLAAILHPVCAFATDSPCCALFGFDAAPMLGQDAALCGRIVDADRRRAAESETLENRRRATQCALEAQGQGRAFVYTYRPLISPDIDMINQAVFGTKGQRLLLRMGLYQGENIRSVETCASLTVLADGRIAKRSCHIVNQ
jgi:hypothetical protein